MAASKKAQVQNENSDNEANSPGDPNLVGFPATAPVQDRRAGSMTPSVQYDEKAPFAGRK